MNQGKSDIIANGKIQALFRNKQKYKYDNRANYAHEFILMTSQFRGKGGELIRVKSCLLLYIIFVFFKRALGKYNIIPKLSSKKLRFLYH